MTRIAPLLALSIPATVFAGPVDGFAGIAYWVGVGVNRTALAVDWRGDDATDEALVWGYRWDGSATGEDLLRAVVAEDPRLYTKLTGFPNFGAAVIGVGYDLNGDGDFAIDDGTLFDGDGVAQTAPSDGAEPLSDDLYREGWEDGYWHYGVRDTSGAWVSSQFGLSDRPLAEGEWHSLAFAVTLNLDEFAENLVAATPPELSADFNGDGGVDAADYTAWRDAAGSADAYATWRAAYGASVAAVAAPAPHAITLSYLTLFTSLLSHHRKRS